MSGVSRIYRMGPNNRTASEKKRDEIKARQGMWHKLGLAVLDPAEISDDWGRQYVINEAEALYGKRKQDGEA